MSLAILDYRLIGLRHTSQTHNVSSKIKILGCIKLKKGSE